MPVVVRCARRLTLLGASCHANSRMTMHSANARYSARAEAVSKLSDHDHNTDPCVSRARCVNADSGPSLMTERPVLTASHTQHVLGSSAPHDCGREAPKVRVRLRTGAGSRAEPR
jgi:hypothetical protein